MNKDEKGNSVSLLPVLSVLTQLRLSEFQFNCHCENSNPDSTNNFCCSRCGLHYHGACYNIEQECVIGSTVADDPFVCGPCSVENNIPCSSNSVKCFYEKKNLCASDEDCASFKLQALIARVIRSLRKNEFLNLQMLKSSDVINFLNSEFGFGEQEAWNMIKKMMCLNMFSLSQEKTSTPGLESMCSSVLFHILQYLNVSTRKKLREVSLTLKNRIEGCGDKTVNYWKLSYIRTYDDDDGTNLLKKFSDAVETVLGVDFDEATHKGVRYLMNKHPEIETLNLGFRNGISESCLRSVLALSNLRMFSTVMSTFRTSTFTVNSRQLHTLALDNSRLNEINATVTHVLSILMTCKESLKSLNISNYKNVRDATLLKLFRICGRTLTTLYIDGTDIPGENLSEYNRTLPFIDNLGFDICQHFSDSGMQKIISICKVNHPSPRINYEGIPRNPSLDDKRSLLCLEQLSLASCSSFSEKGLRKILQLCGRTLKKLDLSSTQITGETLSEGDGVFLTFMEELNISDCNKLTDTGLSSILNVCGKNLKSLNISDTKITGEFLADGNKDCLSCLEELDLGRCYKFTDTEFLRILKLCGRTLKSLDISYSDLTGEKLTEYNGTLPCIEHLDLKGCRHFTDIGLIQLLQLPEKKLKSLRM